MSSARIFLLSPANCGGRRAALLRSPTGRAPLAERLRGGHEVPLGDLFAFVSGLYFRGKLAYAARFAHPPHGAAEGGQAPAEGAYVITPNIGLRSPSAPVRLETLAGFAGVSIAPGNPQYAEPLVRDAQALASRVGSCDVVLLGSIASDKYVDLLLPIFGPRLLFPSAFVGRGDMSRGGLMLRSVAAGAELDYQPIDGAVRHGMRPPRLERWPGA